MKLEQLSDNEWIFYYKMNNKDYSKYIDSLEKLCVWADFLGIKLDELEYALTTMVKMDHNYCEFGNIKKSFIYSGKE